MVYQNLVYKEPAESWYYKARNYKEKSHKKHIHKDCPHACHTLLEQRNYSLFLSLGNKGFIGSELQHYTGIRTLEIGHGNGAPPHTRIV